jgi:hypothetical protein
VAADTATERIAIAPYEPGADLTLATYLASWPGETTPVSVWRQRIAHWWTSNPYCRADTPRGFTLAIDGRLVGFFGLVPMGFQLDGRDVVAFASTTWRVDESARHRSLAALSQVLRAVRHSLLFVWTGTEPLVKILEALKFQRVPRPACFFGRQQTTALIRPGRVLATMTTPLARVPGEIVRVHTDTARLLARLEGRGYSARRIDRASDEVDDFWARTRVHCPNTIPRDATFLNWHCFGGGPVEKWLYACWHGSLMVGLLVGCIKDARGLRVLDCADVWIDPAHPRALGALFSRAMSDAAQKTGADVVELPQYSPEISRFARRIGLLPRAIDDRTELVMAPAPAIDSLRAASGFTGLFGDRYL